MSEQIESGKNHTCLWTKIHDEYNLWQGNCGFEFFFETYQPYENNFNFCPKCGKKIADKNEFNKIFNMTKDKEYINFTVSGIRWRICDAENNSQLKDSLKISIPLSECKTFEDEDDLEEYLSDEISNITGFCHNGWSEYNIDLFQVTLNRKNIDEYCRFAKKGEEFIFEFCKDNQWWTKPYETTLQEAKSEFISFGYDIRQKTI